MSDLIDILTPNEYGCTTLGNIATDRLTEDSDFGQKIVFSEAHFDVGGYVNKQNCRIWKKPARFRFAKWDCDRLTEDADFGKKKSSFQMN